MNGNRGFAVVLEHLYSVLRMDLLATGRTRVTADYLLGTDELLAQQSGNDRFGHHPTTDKRQTTVAESICIVHFGSALLFDRE
jgi:hypothetical protein